MSSSSSSSSPREIFLPSSHPDDLTSLTNGSILFIGNATLLIRWAGFTFLTDPTFIHMHEKVNLGPGLYSERLTNPAMEVSDLPPMDFILLSHFHGDHFDQAAIRGLDKTLPIVTNEHAIEELSARGFTRFEKLEKWESVEFVKGNARLRITATPGRHGPLPVSMFMPQVMGSILDFENASEERNHSHLKPLFRMYVTGDTMVFDEIKEISKRYPGVDVALFHLGGTTVLGIVVTMDAKEGLEMFRIINPKTVIPIHYNDYDVFKSTLDEFQAEVRNAGLEDKVYYIRHGETYNFQISSLKDHH
ncbi:MAG: MBL fold metallo-hydrolase [Nitrososphaeraceae archaeon]